jgi:hypothetical protein
LGQTLNGSGFVCLSFQVDGIEWLVDAFNGGELTALKDAEEVLGKLMGAQVSPKALSHC